MTNFEKYKERAIEIVDTTDTRIAVCNGVLHSCEDVPCGDCDFYDSGNGSCEAKLIRWLYQEYEEKPKLSERTYHFLKSLPEDARIKYTSGFLYINIGDRTNNIYCDDNLFLPKLPPLVEAVWYEVSEILKWEVEE